MLALYGKLERNESCRLAIDGNEIETILNGYIGREVSLSVTEVEDEETEDR